MLQNAKIYHLGFFIVCIGVGSVLQGANIFKAAIGIAIAGQQLNQLADKTGQIVEKTKDGSSNGGFKAFLDEQRTKLMTDLKDVAKSATTDLSQAGQDNINILNQGLTSNTNALNQTLQQGVATGNQLGQNALAAGQNTASQFNQTVQQGVAAGQNTVQQGIAAGQNTAQQYNQTLQQGVATGNQLGQNALAAGQNTAGQFNQTVQQGVAAGQNTAQQYNQTLQQGVAAGQNTAQQGITSGQTFGQNAMTAGQATAQQFNQTAQQYNQALQQGVMTGNQLGQNALAAGQNTVQQGVAVGQNTAQQYNQTLQQGVMAGNQLGQNALMAGQSTAGQFNQTVQQGVAVGQNTVQQGIASGQTLGQNAIDQGVAAGSTVVQNSSNGGVPVVVPAALSGASVAAAIAFSPTTKDLVWVSAQLLTGIVRDVFVAAGGQAYVMAKDVAKGLAGSLSSAKEELLEVMKLDKFKKLTNIQFNEYLEDKKKALEATAKKIGDGTVDSLLRLLPELDKDYFVLYYTEIIKLKIAAAKELFLNGFVPLFKGVLQTAVEPQLRKFTDVYQGFKGTVIGWGNTVAGGAGSALQSAQDFAQAGTAFFSQMGTTFGQAVTDTNAQFAAEAQRTGTNPLSIPVVQTQAASFSVPTEQQVVQVRDVESMGVQTRQQVNSQTGVTQTVLARR